MPVSTIGPLESWIRRASAGSWRNFDDIHLDEVDSRLSTPAEWLNAAPTILRRAAIVRDAEAPEFIVVLGFALTESASEQAPSLNTASEFLREIDDSPPSLYLFHRNYAEWKSDTSSVEAPLFETFLEVLFRAVPSDDRLVRRSVLVVA